MELSDAKRTGSFMYGMLNPYGHRSGEASRFRFLAMLGINKEENERLYKKLREMSFLYDASDIKFCYKKIEKTKTP